MARRKSIFSWIAGLVSAALIVTIAVVANGYDAREVDRDEPSVWAMRTSGQYARVNTQTAEIDTVRAVEDPSGVLQAGAAGAILSHGNGRAWEVDPAAPADFQDGEGGEGAAAGDQGEAKTADPAAQTTDPDAGGEAMRTPEGTRDVVSAGDSVVFRTEDGAAYLSVFEDTGDIAEIAATEGGSLSEPMLLDPLVNAESADAAAGDEGEGDESQRFRADAVAVNDAGLVALFTAATGEVHWYNQSRGEFQSGVNSVPAEVPDDGLQLAIVAGDWVMLDAENGLLWREGGSDPIELETSSTAKLQASSGEEAGTDVLVADESGLLRVTENGEAERIVEADGTPAQPIAMNDDQYGAWLGATSGTLWSSADNTLPLELDDSVSTAGDPLPVIRTNGSHALVSEERTGMMWTVPDGKLIPVEQWSLVDPPKEEQGMIVVNDVTEQEPPVAVDDVFGVRPGEPAPLPVLLNDYDPNRRDVLTILPESLQDGIPEEFGRIEMLANGQGLIVTPSSDATGSATFTYRVSDGTHTSEPATVRLNAVVDDSNAAPEWCPVDGCQLSWPTPELAPGGTLVLPILEGWVDPQGDPMMLESATLTNSDDPARVLVTPDGSLALRHSDPNASDGEVTVRLTVTDARGESRERDLTVNIRSGAEMQFASIAHTVKVGEPTNLQPLRRVTGGSGSFTLVDAVAQGGTLDINVNRGAGRVEVNASEVGSTVLTVTVRDHVTGGEVSGSMRVSAVEQRADDLGMPPMRAFVKPLTDTTISVLDAIPGSNSRSLVVRSADVLDGDLRIDVIEHSRLRVSGATEDGQAGRIGAADIQIAEGAEAGSGRLTVFQVPEGSSNGAIAVADTATVRAGSVVDISVLENDVSPLGERLVLHPEITGSGTTGELAFASGNSLRYLAPSEPGTYTLSYTTYGASAPESGDVGQVQVTVLPRDGNRDPLPPTLTVRIAPGAQEFVSVPLSNVDPDGDRVRLTGVSSPEDQQLNATLAPRSSAIQVEASRKSEAGTSLISYTVRDEFGGEATGRLRIIVTDGDALATAPIVYSDYVRLTQGTTEPATVRPLDNDFDPARGTLELTEVVPNVPGGADSAQGRQLSKRLDTSGIDDGLVRVTGGSELGTVSYRYTVQSTESKSTSQGLIVVQVSDRVGLQAPTVEDTVLSARDRTELARGGVDVVTDRVRWAAGDPSSLELSLWGNAKDRYQVRGNNIVGTYRGEGDLVPFRLAGVDASGEAVESFGFLVVPPLDDLRLSLKPGVQPVNVEENDTASVNVNDYVDLASGDRIELESGAYPVQRAQASCESTGASTLQYAAGKEAPWTDSCVFSVRLAEQNTWTQLALPIIVQPTDPTAELEAMTRTVQAGASETVNLTDMVRWQGGREGNLRSLQFQVSSAGSAFSIVQNGQSAEITARADATPGAQETATVSVSGAGEDQAPLSLRVGAAPRDNPRGGTVSLQCNVGSNCGADLIGVPGEYDPFDGQAGSGLELVSVSAGSCAYGNMNASGDRVNVSWPDSRGPGGQCTATFTVEDAQGRTGTGTIEFDARGVPRAPTNVTATGANASSVTLTVGLSSQASHPGVSGVEIVTSNGRSVASCSPSGSSATCTVSGLTPGEKRTYFARATNDVGASERSANGAETWAYEPPSAPNVEVERVRDRDNTDQANGRVRVTVSGARDARSFEMIGGDVEGPISRGTTEMRLPVGPKTIAVIGVNGELPPGYSGSGRGSEGRASVEVAGAPTSGGADLVSAPGTNSATIQISGWGANYGGEPEYRFCLWRASGGDRNCQNGDPNFAGLDKHLRYAGSVEATTQFGRTVVETGPTRIGGSVPQLDVTRGYSVNTSASGGPTLYTYRVGTNDGSQPQFANAVAQVQYNVPPRDLAPGQQLTAWQCVDGECSEPVIVPANGPSTASIEWASDDCATSQSEILPKLTVIGNGEEISAEGVGAPGEAGDVVVSWNNGSLNSVTFSGKFCLPPEPEPTPPPTP